MLGVLKVSPDAIDSYTMQEVELAYIGHHTANRYAEQAAWERARLISFYVLKPYSKTLHDPKDLFYFGWEDKPDVKNIIKEMKKDPRFPSKL